MAEVAPADSSSSTTSLVFAGICSEIAATMVGTAGKQLVTYSVRLDKKQGRWFKRSGLLLTTLVGPILDMIAYALAPQSELAPLIGLDIVWNTCSAPYTLGERLQRRHVIGSTLVFIGAALSSMFGQHHEEVKNLEWLNGIFSSSRFFSYAALFVALLVLAYLVLRRNPPGCGSRTRGFTLGLSAGGIAGNMFFMSAGLGLLLESWETKDWEAWDSWLPYFVLGGGLACAVGNVPLMAKGLEEFEALFMVTMFEGSHISVACLSSVWVLGEVFSDSWYRGIAYLSCVALIGAGLMVIQSTVGLGAGRDKKYAAQELDWEFESDGEVDDAEAQNRSLKPGGSVMWTSYMQNRVFAGNLLEDSGQDSSSLETEGTGRAS